MHLRTPLVVAIAVALTGVGAADSATAQKSKSKYRITSAKQIHPRVLSLLRGQRGAIGPAGAPGARGADGSRGADGARGSDGAPGAQGAAGARGSDGQNAPGYSAGDGLDLSGTVFSVDFGSVQERLTDDCIGGKFVTGVNDEGQLACETLPAGNEGDVTGVTAGTGLSGGGSTGEVTLSADTTYLQRRLAAECASGKAIRAVSQDGTVSCDEVGDITGVTAGTGLSGGGSSGGVSLGVDDSVFQRRLSGSCPAGQFLVGIAQNGASSCLSGGDVEAVTTATGSGLSGGGESGALSLAIAPDGVTAARLADSASVDADRAVTTNHIRDNAVVADKIASGAVGSDEVGFNALTDQDLGQGSVGTSEVANGSLRAVDAATVTGQIDVPATVVTSTAPCSFHHTTVSPSPGAILPGINVAMPYAWTAESGHDISVTPVRVDALVNRIGIQVCYHGGGTIPAGTVTYMAWATGS